MNEKQRTKRIRHELEKTRVQLARQDAELEALEAEMDPAALEEAEQTLDERIQNDSEVAAFAESLGRVSRLKEKDHPKPFVPAHAMRV